MIKKMFKGAVVLVTVTMMLSSCATIFGGKITKCQKQKPKQGSATGRRVRVGAFVADAILFPASLIVDFATCAIYRPCNTTQ